jgi:hypothetical protein
MQIEAGMEWCTRTGWRPLPHWVGCVGKRNASALLFGDIDIAHEKVEGGSEKVVGFISAHYDSKGFHFLVFYSSF